jgi:hypothetical protein
MTAIKLPSRPRAVGPRLASIRAFVWALCGAVVVLFAFFAAIGGIDPSETTTLTLVVVLLAVAWLAHAWPRLVAGRELGSRADRERRGF